MNNWARNHQGTTWIATGVILVHMVTLSYLLTHRPEILNKIPAKIAVHTKVTPKPKVIKTAAKKTKRSGKKRPPLKKGKKIAPLPPTTQVIAPPKPLQKLQVNKEMEEKYASQIIQKMQQSLSLPEYGEVKLSLTVHKSGEVRGIEILTSQSDANREYLETHLKTLAFPKLEGGLRSETHTFLISFCNAL